MKKETEHYDAIIIGAGQGGTPLAKALADEGWRTALIERKHLGGTCVNTGCTPTKTLVASAHMAHLARRAEDFGINVDSVNVDMASVIQRKRDMVESFRQGSLRGIQDSPVDLIRGTARFAPDTDQTRRLAVEMTDGSTRTLIGDRIFVDVGARPRVPDIPGLNRLPFLNSTTIMELDEVPEHLLIIGGGYVGVEFGQMFRRFGSRVSIVQRGSQLLTREDADVADTMAEILAEEGVQILLDAHPTRASAMDDGTIQLTLDMGADRAARTLSGSHLLIAAGRVPNSDDLNLEAAGIDTDQGEHIVVDEQLRTTAPGVYALGDVKGGPAFTHISYDDFRILRTNLLEDGEATVHDRPIPYAVFTEPQLGRVGLTEKQARARDRAYGLAKMPMSSISRALEIGQSQGFMKALVDPSNDQILGCAVLGVQGSEIMAMMQIAMMGSLPYTALRDGIFVHPTLAESMNTLFSSIDFEH